MRNLAFRSGVLALLVALTASCAGPTGTPQPATPGTQVPQGYPEPNTAGTPVGGYPDSTAAPTLPPGEVPFRLDKPLVAGATEVTGSGTPGVPLLLQNVTFMGEMIAQTTVDDSGRFAFTVPPLEAEVRIGISVGDLAGTRWTPDYFLAPGFRGDEGVSLPNVGYFLDTALVPAP
jgi:hypothetical protein